MVLFGASGHAKVIMNIANLLGYKVDFLIDDNRKIQKFCDLPVFGRNQILLNENSMVISIGDNRVRREISEWLKCRFEILIHPASILDTTVTTLEGTVIMAGVVINRDTQVGKHVIINTSSSIDHDCIIEDYVHISPNATLCGTVHVGEGTQIGAGAVVSPNIKIGKWAVIGAGAVIIRDIPDFAVVVGNPGKIIKYTND
ncbi:acetyltransferase [Roseivirga seohaensis]|uniref:Acetyltransferase n=1 Tax=Roseivirga seohaensis TaxID=1914963 RepID=A0A150XMK1_9BACT|nr:acetyltransferase [Roseivirga seohaensis]KYG79862.1 acetyltransferase [Roseivirga seohaensis]